MYSKKNAVRLAWSIQSPEAVVEYVGLDQAGLDGVIPHAYDHRRERILREALDHIRLAGINITMDIIFSSSEWAAFDSLVYFGYHLFSNPLTDR
jgi:hypothetical protein